MTSIHAFTNFAITADQTLTSLRNEKHIPFVHNYPKNCCELISVHLGLVLEAANPEKNVKVVRAYSHKTDEWHYWVEMDGLVFDFTAHQFEEHKQPLVIAKPSPFEILFSDLERISTSDAEREAPFTVNPKLKKIFSACYQLVSSPPLTELPL